MSTAAVLDLQLAAAADARFELDELASFAQDALEIELAAAGHRELGGYPVWSDLALMYAAEEPCVLIDTALTGTSGTQMATCHPCGVEFRIQRADQVDKLVAAVQQHASGSHGHDVAREHILAELVRV